MPKITEVDGDVPNWEEIQKEWETSEISFNDLAESMA